MTTTTALFTEASKARQAIEGILNEQSPHEITAALTQAQAALADINNTIEPQSCMNPDLLHQALVDFDKEQPHADNTFKEIVETMDGIFRLRLREDSEGWLSERSFYSVGPVLHPLTRSFNNYLSRLWQTADDSLKEKFQQDLDSILEGFSNRISQAKDATQAWWGMIIR